MEFWEASRANSRPMRRLTVPLNTSSSEVTDESSLCLAVGGLRQEPEPDDSLPERRTMSAGKNLLAWARNYRVSLNIPMSEFPAKARISAEV
jgi:hypothetical protein